MHFCRTIIPWLIFSLSIRLLFLSSLLYIVLFGNVILSNSSSVLPHDLYDTTQDVFCELWRKVLNSCWNGFVIESAAKPRLFRLFYRSVLKFTVLQPNHRWCHITTQLIFYHHWFIWLMSHGIYVTRMAVDCLSLALAPDISYFLAYFSTLPSLRQ